MPPKKSNYGDCKTPFKAFYRKIGKLLIEDHRLGKVETDNYKFWNELNNSKEEYTTLKGLNFVLTKTL